MMDKNFVSVKNTYNFIIKLDILFQGLITYLIYLEIQFCFLEIATLIHSYNSHVLKFLEIAI